MCLFIKENKKRKHNIISDSGIAFEELHYQGMGKLASEI